MLQLSLAPFLTFVSSSNRLVDVPHILDVNYSSEERLSCFEFNNQGGTSTMFDSHAYALQTIPSQVRMHSKEYNNCGENGKEKSLFTIHIGGAPSLHRQGDKPPSPV
jgi:hypothetical protein